MKRPKHMTMKELLALPVIDDRAALLADVDPEDAGRCYGGAFEDDDGYIWGTFNLNDAWVRYPAYLALLGPIAREQRGARDPMPPLAAVSPERVAHHVQRAKVDLVGAFLRRLGLIAAKPPIACHT